MKKKTVSLLLTLVMMVSVFTVGVFAEENEATVAEPETTVAESNTEKEVVETTSEEEPALEMSEESVGPVLRSPQTPPTKLEVTPPSLSMKVGGTGQINVTIEPAGTPVAYASSDTSVATVGDKGLVKGVKAGTATITVSSGGVSKAVSVTVTDDTVVPVTSVTVTPLGTEVKVGLTVTLTASVKPDNATDKTVAWSSSDESIAKVSSSGVVTGVKEGTADITAKVGDKTATVKVTVKPAEPTPLGKINNVKVYYNSVTGYAPANSKVTLYRNGSYIGSTTADSKGYFSISHSFGYYNGYYKDYYWKDYWKDYGYHWYYNLSDYTLKATDSSNNLLDTYYLSNANGYYDDYYWWGNGYYWNNDYWYNGYNGYNGRVYPTSLSLNSSGRYVEGYLSSYPNTYVAVYRNGSYLGSGYTNSSGYFSISLNEYVSSASSLDFYLNRGTGYYYDEPSNRIYPWSLTVNSYSVSGYYNANTLVKVYYDGKYIGSDTTDSNGYFNVASSIRLYNDSLLKFYGEKTTVKETKPTSTTSTYKTTITIGSAAISKTVDGITTTTYMDVAPYIKEGRTMLPIRFVAESLGYAVTFNDTTRNATFSDGNKLVILNIDSSEFYVDGVKYTFTVKPEIKDGRTMLPISEIGRALGLTHGNKGEGKNIEWDSVNRVVTIETTKTK